MKCVYAWLLLWVDMMSDVGALPDNAPRPRLCRVTKWEHFDGYGFNLHAEKSKPGQFIGKVDLDSPAEAAGLKEGDRIIEVNGVNINHENHKQVVQRIKAMTNETTLLVVDKEAETFYKRNEIVVTGAMANIDVRSSDDDHHHHHHNNQHQHHHSSHSLGRQESRSSSGSPMMTTTTPDSAGGVLLSSSSSSHHLHHHHEEDSDRRSNDGSVGSAVSSSDKVKT